MVIVGEDEKANGGVKIRDVNTRQEVSSELCAEFHDQPVSPIVKFFCNGCV